MNEWHHIKGTNLGWFYAGGAIQYCTYTGYLSGNAWTRRVNERLEETAKHLKSLRKETANERNTWASN